MRAFIGVRNGLMVMAVVYTVIVLSACTVHAGIDWQGETQKDFRTFSQKDKK